MFLVRENDFPQRVCKGNKILVVNMTVRAVVFHLILVTGGAIRLLGQEVVRRTLARLRTSMAILARRTDILHVKFVRELDQFRTIFLLPRLRHEASDGRACLQWCLTRGHCNDDHAHENKNRYEISTNHRKTPAGH
jgi:hypothetical protein